MQVLAAPPMIGGITMPEFKFRMGDALRCARRKELTPHFIYGVILTIKAYGFSQIHAGPRAAMINGGFTAITHRLYRQWLQLPAGSVQQSQQQTALYLLRV